MNQRPFFSVVIPLYNREKLILNTIQSVFNQDVEVTFEIIIVDDGSKDGSAHVVKRIGDPRIKYIHQNNAGATTARNTGIDAATGKYIALLDSDDTFLPHHLRANYDVLKDNPNLVLYSRIVVDRGDAGTFLKPPRTIRKDEHMSDYLLRDRGFVQTSTVVLPAELAKRVRYKEGLPYGQDTDFAIRLYAHGAEFKMLDEPGAIWVDIDDSNRVSTRFTAASRLNWLESVKDIITPKAYLGDCGWPVAKGFVKEGRYFKALSLYLKAVLNGCYSFRLAGIIGMQVVFGDFYRQIADFYIKAKNR